MNSKCGVQSKRRGCGRKAKHTQFLGIVQELCESRGGRPGLSWAVHPNEPSGFRGRKAILNHASALVSVCP